jgi:hypothetical protein
VDRPRSAFFLLLSGQAPRLAGRLEHPCLGQGLSGTRSRNSTRGHPCHDQAAAGHPGPMPRSPHPPPPRSTTKLPSKARHPTCRFRAGWSRLTTKRPPQRAPRDLDASCLYGRPDTFNRGAHVHPDGRANPSFCFSRHCLSYLSFSHPVRSLISDPTETLRFRLTGCFGPGQATSSLPSGPSAPQDWTATRLGTSNI